jgi:Outer membrane protein beta-barrel domain
VRGTFAASWFVLLTAVAYGQAQIDLGLKGGVNFALVNSVSTAVSTYGVQTGYHGGAYAMFKFGNVAVQPEIIYSSEGQQYKYVQAGFPNLKSTFGYINVPVLLKVYVAEGFNFQGGPQFGFLTNSMGYTYATRPTLGAPPAITYQSLGDYVKYYDISFALGAGLDLPFGLNFTLRYNAGLTDINKLTGSNTVGPTSAFGTSAAKSEVFQISVGYRLFKIGS